MRLFDTYRGHIFLFKKTCILKTAENNRKIDKTKNIGDMTLNKLNYYVIVVSSRKIIKIRLLYSNQSP